MSGLSNHTCGKNMCQLTNWCVAINMYSNHYTILNNLFILCILCLHQLWLILRAIHIRQFLQRLSLELIRTLFEPAHDHFTLTSWTLLCQGTQYEAVNASAGATGRGHSPRNALSAWPGMSHGFPMQHVVIPGYHWWISSCHPEVDIGWHWPMTDLQLCQTPIVLILCNSRLTSANHERVLSHVWTELFQLNGNIERNWHISALNPWFLSLGLSLGRKQQVHQPPKWHLQISNGCATHRICTIHDGRFSQQRLIHSYLGIPSHDSHDAWTNANSLLQSGSFLPESLPLCLNIPR